MPQRFLSRVLLLLGGLGACMAGAEPAPTKGQQEATSLPSVTRQQAQDLLRRFQRDAPVTRAQLFGRPMLEELLAEGVSPAVTISFGLDPAERSEHLVFTAAGSAQAFDDGLPCPSFCPPGDEMDLAGDVAGQRIDGGGACPSSCSPERGVVAFDRGGLCPPNCPPEEGALVAEAIPEALTAHGIARSGARISGSLARTLTASYRAAHPGERGSICFSRAELARLLADPEVHGLWFFFGRRATGHRALVITPADGRGALLTPRGLAADTAPSILGAVAGTPCPDEAHGTSETDETTPNW